ncbi:F510_1955 family glycosylhydrolase [Bacillus pinisoli]|uniref:F510_1955 family glycosylhydrolase n=1 Tax=Bacillus pinisoli TaxID=2901866 RepID=UPI001FF30F25|nr:hypothetical protein [Bacillus pinisoli]
MKYIIFLLGLGAVLFFFFASSSDNTNQPQRQDINIENEKSMEASGIPFSEHIFFQPLQEPIFHLHGLGYPNNQGALFLATHHGLKVFYNGQWLETRGNNHDYMGFQATADGFYTSGHPEEGTELANPIGLMKSEDLGETLEKVSFYGESDFHHLSAGYFTQSIYVVNTVPNSQIETGLYYSTDGGTSWENSRLEGLPLTSAHSIATHPRLAKTVGISTPEGLYLSHNKGNSFSLVSEEIPVGAVFIKEESILYVVEDGNNRMLLEQPLESDDTKEIPLPSLKEDESILYLAVSPINEEEISFSTDKGNVWTTTNYGNSWSNILVEGNVP